MTVRVVVTWRIKLVLEPIDTKNSKLHNFVSRPRNLQSKMFLSVWVTLVYQECRRFMKTHWSWNLTTLSFKRMCSKSLQMTSSLLKKRNLPNPDETRRKVIKWSLIIGTIPIKLNHFELDLRIFNTFWKYPKEPQQLNKTMCQQQIESSLRTDPVITMFPTKLLSRSPDSALMTDVKNKG